MPAKLLSAFFFVPGDPAVRVLHMPHDTMKRKTKACNTCTYKHTLKYTLWVYRSQAGILIIMHHTCMYHIYTSGLTMHSHGPGLSHHFNMVCTWIMLTLNISTSRYVRTKLLIVILYSLFLCIFMGGLQCSKHSPTQLDAHGTHTRTHIHTHNNYGGVQNAQQSIKLINSYNRCE